MVRWQRTLALAVLAAWTFGCSGSSGDGSSEEPTAAVTVTEEEAGLQEVAAEGHAAPAPSPPALERPPARDRGADTPRRAEPKPEPAAPRIVEIEVPTGTVLELELLTALDSSVNRAGDEIQAKTLSPLYIQGDLVMGSGAYVEGRVTEAQASGRVKGRAQIAFTFDRLKTPGGLKTIRTSYVEQEAESGKKKDAAIIGGAAGVGAIVGGIIGGKKGAAIGATVGGAGGTGVVLSTKGEEIRLPAGSRLNVRLDEPLVIQVN